MRYELLSVLSLVTDEMAPRSPTPSPQANSHLILHSMHAETGAQWYCFNDYAIHESSLQDALCFTEDWKTPICLVYCCKDIPDDRLRSLLNAPSRPIPPPFYSATSLGVADIPLSFRMLPMDRLPGRGELVSIDCEFIALNCEQVG